MFGLISGLKKKEGQEELHKSNVVCKLCHLVLKYSSNTTNLRSHLARHHADIPQANVSVKQKHLAPNQLTMDSAFVCKLPSSSAHSKKITESVAVFISKDICPYSVVENDGFRHMLHTLEPSSQPANTSPKSRSRSCMKIKWGNLIRHRERAEMTKKKWAKRQLWWHKRSRRTVALRTTFLPPHQKDQGTPV
ncbi:hypothetical protein COCON_G00012310, partial [Conger conger]